MTAQELLKHHVTGAIERGEKEAIVGQAQATTPITEQEQAEATLLKRSCPFRDWHIVKIGNEPAIFVDSRRKALAQIKKHPSAVAYKIA